MIQNCIGIIGTNLVAKHYATLSHPKAALLKSLGRRGFDRSPSPL